MRKGLVWLGAFVLATALAQAEVRIGVTLSATGPAASLGIPEKNTLLLIEAGKLDRMPKGVTVRFFILDDGTDPTAAVKNTKKLIQENRVHLIIGGTTSPNSLAMIDAVAEAGVPFISLAAAKAIVAPVDEKRYWVFKTPQTDELMSQAVVQDMVARGYKTVAYLGFNTAYGEGWAREFEKAAKAAGLEVVASERYSPKDTSVTGQVLKILSRRPDAVLIGAAGTPAVLPQRTLVEKGYKGQIYQTHGVANPAFLKVGGEFVENTLLPAGPILVAAQLPDAFPSKRVALTYIAAYEAAHGVGSYSTFGGHAYDAWLIARDAIERALEKADPGDLAAFRKALRDAIEGTRGVVGTHGVFNLSPTDHLGLKFEEAAVIVRVKDGKWVLERSFR